MFGIIKSAVINVTCDHPFFITHLYSMQYKETHDVPTLASDGSTLFVNPTFFASYPYPTFALLHELAHKILDHSHRRNHRDPYRWNVAADYAANQLLHDCGIPLPPDVLYDPAYQNLSAEAIYQRLPATTNKPTFANDILPPTQPSNNKQITTRAAQAAKEANQFPEALQRLTNHILQPKPEPWYDRLYRYMQPTKEYSWNRTNHRTLHTHGILTPYPASPGFQHVVFYVDTSGSVLQKAFQHDFINRTQDILNAVKPQTVITYFFNTKIHTKHEGFTVPTDIPLGGGTDFNCLFPSPHNQPANHNQPDIHIVLTDLISYLPEPFPTPPPEPVIWLSTTQNQAPYGETIGLLI